jgi:uncharacterized protein
MHKIFSKTVLSICLLLNLAVISAPDIDPNCYLCSIHPTSPCMHFWQDEALHKAAVEEIKNEDRFLLAISREDIETVKQALHDGIDINKIEVRKYPAPHELTALGESIKTNNLILVQMIIDAGADLSRKMFWTSHEISTLNYAILNKTDSKIIELLIKKGVNIHEQDTMGKTSLMHAVTWNRQDVVKILLAAGADINAKDKNQQSALTRALGNPDMMWLLLEAGARQ